jgi:hypothetical protein
MALNSATLNKFHNDDDGGVYKFKNEVDFLKRKVASYKSVADDQLPNSCRNLLQIFIFSVFLTNIFQIYSLKRKKYKRLQIRETKQF